MFSSNQIFSSFLSQKKSNSAKNESKKENISSQEKIVLEALGTEFAKLLAQAKSSREITIIKNNFSIFFQAELSVSTNSNHTPSCSASPKTPTSSSPQDPQDNKQNKKPDNNQDKKQDNKIVKHVSFS